METTIKLNGRFKMYRNNLNLNDVQSAIENAETECRNMRDATLEDAISVLDDIESAISNIESELSYVDDEMADLKEYKDACWEIESRFGGIDPDDWNIVDPDEHEALTADVERYKKALEQSEIELGNIKGFHENQRKLILALLDRMREIGDLSSQGALDKLFADVAMPETPMLQSDLSNLPPNCS